jgi:hypothetical protein
MSAGVQRQRVLPFMGIAIEGRMTALESHRYSVIWLIPISFAAFSVENVLIAIVNLSQSPLCREVSCGKTF